MVRAQQEPFGIRDHGVNPRKGLGRLVGRDRRSVMGVVKGLQLVVDGKPKPIVWRKTAEEISEKVGQARSLILS